MCSQAASAERSGGACVAAALAQDHSLATAGSAHLKHVEAVFAGLRKDSAFIRGVNL